MRRRLTYFVGGGFVCACAMLFAYASTVKPRVSASNLFIDTVKYGDLVDEIEAPGVLAPESVRFVSPLVSARIEQIVAPTGTKVRAGDVLFRLSSPDAEIALLEARQALSTAEVSLATSRSAAIEGILTQQHTIASARTAALVARLSAVAAESLSSQRLISVNELLEKRALLDETTGREHIETARLREMRSAAEAQRGLQQRQVSLLRQLVEFHATRQASLVLRTPTAGLVQDVVVQPGQWVNAGTAVAKVVAPGMLRARIRVPEGLASQVLIGQPARVWTRNFSVSGRVAGTEPSAFGGTLGVEVAFGSKLPPGAVPDLNVNAAIEVQRWPNVLYIKIPLGDDERTASSVFVFTADGASAERRQVVFGRRTGRAVQIVQGVGSGDRVVLTDMSTYLGARRIDVVR